MRKRLIFECGDYVEWEVEEIIWLNPDGSYTPSYLNNIHILESRIVLWMGKLLLPWLRMIFLMVGAQH